MPILIKPFLFLIAFGPIAVLFASVIGLACWLLMVCVSGPLHGYPLGTPRMYLGRTYGPPQIGHKALAVFLVLTRL
jgi:hypothetical protein